MSETRECRHCGAHTATFLIGLDDPTWLCDDCAHANRLKRDPEYAHECALDEAERAVVEACLAEVEYIDSVRGKDISKMGDPSRFKAANKFVALANDRLAAVRALRTLRAPAAVAAARIEERKTK